MSTFQGLSCGWKIGIFKFKELGNIVISAPKYPSFEYQLGEGLESYESNSSNDDNEDGINVLAITEHNGWQRKNF